ncbi:hypothetical protein [Flavobacterium sp.]|uniref:hypothetical protein n=1 Tax=Flavobacterium sp. TaxID=239 RepID=UPI00391AC792
MAAYILNISVDAPDVVSYKAEDLSFNDQESIVEIVIEKILNYDNLIQEMDDNDNNEQSSTKKNFHLDFFVLNNVTVETSKEKTSFAKSFSFWTTQKAKLPCYKKSSPPPEV